MEQQNKGKHSVFYFEVPETSSEEFSQLLWEQWPGGVEGIQEALSMDKAGALISVPEEFSVLEFGSEAARRCAQWMHEEAFKKNTAKLYLSVYVLSVPCSDEQELQKGRKAFLIRARKLFGAQLIGGPLIVHEKDYIKSYQEQVKGVLLNPDLWIGPPWEEPPESLKHSQALALKIEPATAFGTGEHPTTQLCLLALQDEAEAVRKGKRPAPGRILDLGSGSGVLSLAARHFFPKAQILVADLDPAAEFEFVRNAQLNAVSNAGFEFFWGDRGSAEALCRSGVKPVDLLLSNIYAEVLAASLESIAALKAPDGLWVASGILEGPSEDKLLKRIKKLLPWKQRSRLCRHNRHPQLNLQAGLDEACETWVRLEYI